jgi:hypothetical protein
MPSMDIRSHSSSCTPKVSWLVRDSNTDGKSLHRSCLTNMVICDGQRPAAWPLQKNLDQKFTGQHAVRIAEAFQQHTMPAYVAAWFCRA